MADKFELTDTAPVAPNGKANVKWQSDIDGNISAYVEVDKGVHIIQDEGVALASFDTLNFAGAGVTAAVDIPNNRINVTIPGGSQTPWTQNIDAATFSLNNAGALDTAAPGTLGTNKEYAAIRVHEVGRAGFAGGDMAYSPRISFEWPGFLSAQIGLLNSGATATLRTFTDLGSDYAAFACGDIALGSVLRQASISVPSDGAADSGAFVISTRSLGTLAERMRIGASGGVSVKASLTATNVININSNAAINAFAQLLLLYEDIPRWSVAKDDSNDFVLRRFNSGGAFVDNPIAVSAATGNTGIGGAAHATYKVNVTGDCNITGVYRVNGTTMLGVSAGATQMTIGGVLKTLTVDGSGFVKAA